MFGLSGCVVYESNMEKVKNDGRQRQFIKRIKK